jgi:aryl-alcohol dehydrogenase-like predicted oxidoreductase
VGTPARFDPLDVTKEESLAAVGVGKLEVLEFRDALAVAGQGEGRLACNQVLYHLQQRAIEHAVLPWWPERHGVAVTAYSPFGHGISRGPAPRAGASYFRKFVRRL